MVESSGGAVTCAQEKWLSSLPPNIRPQVIDEGGHVVVLGRAEPYAWIVLLFLQIGMMVGMARQPPNLDNLMNEGIAFAIDRFQVSLPDCPIRRRPVIIGRTKPAYNTIEKVMERLNRIMMVIETMRHIAIVDVHGDFFIKRVTCPISVLMFFCS